MQQISVDLGDRSYPILAGAGLITRGDLLRSHIKGSQVCIVTDDTVAPLYLEAVSRQLEGLRVISVVLPTGEAYKNWSVLQQILDALLAARFDRKCCLLALGGGVVGDMTGFAAAIYQRGVDFIQVPTTLLSQVDSSVGGKTGINHPAGKNMIGAFYQPQAVIMDTDTLRTLPAREISAGLAEIIKYGLIRDVGFLAWLEQNMLQLRALDAEAVIYAIVRSCEIKAEVVAADEREGGVRAILNLGHTFGHAIEAHLGYGRWLHGEAVGAGMVMAADLSRRLGWITQQDQQRAISLISAAGLPVSSPEGMEVADYQLHMSVDKKVMDGKLRLVLLKQLGEAVVTGEFAPQALISTLEHACNAR